MGILMRLCLLVFFWGPVLLRADQGQPTKPVIVEDKVDFRKELSTLNWSSQEKWTDLKVAYFQNEVIWPFYFELKKKPFDLQDSDYALLIRGVAYLAMKSDDHYAAEVLSTMKHHLKISVQEIKEYIKLVDHAPAREKLQEDLKTLFDSAGSQDDEAS